MAACTQCGQRTAPGARWCTQCGTPVPDVSLVVPPRTTAYDPPALIDVAAGSSSTRDITPAPPSRTPDAAATTAAFNPVPPPPPRPPTRQTAATPPPARDHRIQPGVLIALIGTLVLVVALVAVVAVTNLGGDGEPGDDTASADGSGSGATEVAADAEVAVPDTAPDGQDAEGNAVSYAPANLLDGDPSSTWRMPGDAAGDEITLSWAEPVTITGVGMVNGYAKVDEATGDERYGQNRRVLGVTWVFDDGTEVSKTLEETEDMQSFQLDAPVETSSVTIRIDDTSDPGGRDFTAVSELSFLAG